jgi:hypothetical protein
VAKTAKCATFRVRVKVVPCDGYEMVQMVRGEFLFLKKGDPQRNTIVEASTMASVFEELANGGLRDEFGYGYRIFWRIDEIVESGR